MAAGEESATPLEEVIEQILEERRRGVPPDLEAVLRRHPEYAEELRELLPALELLERARDRAPEPRERASDDRASSSDRQRSDRAVPLAEVLERLASRAAFFERYELRDEIGRGGQGAVLAVWDEDLHRSLAMKRLRTTGEKGSSAIETRSLGRFLDEAQVTAQLDHPGIVPVHELGLDAEGGVYFTMKLVKGRDLRAIFELVERGEEGWTRTRALNLMLKVCEAMAYAHSKGVIHRDLKPSNVMVGRYGEVHVMDWGLARVLGREDRKDIRIQPALATSAVHTDRGDASLDLDSPLITMEGDVVGTPAYMSPEQARGELEALGPQSDVYSLGAMLYHLLAGHMPYVLPTSRLTNHAIWALVQRGPPDSLQDLAPSAPAELVAICERAMAREASARYADMGALAEDLRAYLENRVVSAHRTGALVELRKWIGRNRALALASAAAIVLALGGLGGVGYVQARGKRTADAQRANVMRLSAFQELKDLKREGDELWPPWPQHDQAYGAWLQRAKDLVAGLDPDPEGKDIGHRARLRELEARALPRTDAEREADRRSHPRFAELERLSARIAAFERAQAVRSGKAVVEEAVLDPASLPKDASALNELAWKRVNPDNTAPDQVGVGLGLARMATSKEGVEAASRAGHLDTLAWALFVNGLDEEAIGASEAALDEAPGERKDEYRGYLDRLRREIDAARSGATLSRLEGERDALEAELASRRTWRFENEEDRWWHSQLVGLVVEIEALADPETGLIEGFSPEHGEGIARRLALSQSLAERTVRKADASRRWSEAIASISSPGDCPAYGGLLIEPQIGLLPIGRDPDSGLWEFAHLQTGEPAERGPDGKLVIEEETGLVFVLLPGGAFSMGAQSHDPRGPSYVPTALGDEGPVHRVTLSPFFLSKYEMSQGQWLRVKGSNPSHAGSHFWQPHWSRTRERGDLTHPVEEVSWLDSVQICSRMGCVLPSEARWEYGARGGTTTAWWTGDDVESLQGAANVADAFARSSVGDTWNGNEEALDDDWAWHAPVDSFRANPFGLHNVHGNVSEPCLEGMNGSFYLDFILDPVVDPVAPAITPGTFAGRGGTFWDKAEFARSANRDYGTIAGSSYWAGVRPAREIRGEIRCLSEQRAAR